MYFSSDDVLKAEHKLLADAVAGDSGAESCFTSGYITGIVALAEELVTKKKEGDDG